MLERYGVAHSVDLPWYSRNNGRKSKIHLIVESILRECGIEFLSEVPNLFSSYNKKLERVYSPIVDILIPSKKLVIEVNGDKWHANPKKYKEDDLIRLWRGNRHDGIRKEQIESFGYKVMVLWASDIKKNREFVKKSILLEYENC